MLRRLKVKMSGKGFTIIEMLVAVTIFTLIVGSATGLFISAVRSQSKALAAQKLLDETSYVMEYMSRALRMAKKETNAPSCLSSNGLNYENPSFPSLDSIKFIKYEHATNQDVCYEFFLDGDQLKERKNGGTANALTSNKVKVTSLKFVDSISSGSWSGSDSYQPRVTITLTAQKEPEGKPEIKIQTTISQRSLDLN